jgi:murein DD-endopeptidase MepM/ murein hydrolase activator NlpD
MNRFLDLPTKLTALILFSSFGASTAFAQQPGSPDRVPSVDRDAPVPTTPKPLAPSPSLVIGLAGVSAGPAQIVPPAPRIVAHSARTIAIPSGGLSPAGYSTQRAAQRTTWTDLKINSSFGYRRDPFSRRGRRHTGVDLKAAYGETVGAALAGTVAFAGVKRGYGNIVMLEHGNGISTYYAHLSSIGVEVGQSVSASQVIGQIGSTGRATSPHLHYEVRANGQPINPLATIAFDGAQVLVDGRPLSETEAEGWGDETTTVIPNVAGADGSNNSPTRARRVAKQPPAEKRLLVFGEDSLTEY